MALVNQSSAGVVIGLVGVLLGFVSLIAAYIFYRRSRPQAGIAFQSTSSQFPGRTRTPSEEIEITFRGERVPQITKSLISIWNSGNTTIDGQQIVNTDPLRIVTTSGSRVLDVTILRSTREVNRFIADKGDRSNEIISSFEWLDPGDGALVKVLHTGEKGPRVDGTLRGVPRGVVDLGILAQPQRKQSMFEKVLGWFGRLTAVTVLLGSIVLAMRQSLQITQQGKLAPIIVASLASVLLLLLLLLLCMALLRQVLRKPPKRLRLSEIDI